MTNPRQRAEQLYTSGEAAREAGVSRTCLQIYELRGIVVPLRTQRGRRVYTQAHVDAIRAEYLKNTKAAR